MSRGAFSSDMVYSMNDLSELKAYAFDRGVEIILGMLIIFCIYIYIQNLIIHTFIPLHIIYIVIKNKLNHLHHKLL